MIYKIPLPQSKLKNLTIRKSGVTNEVR